MIPIIDTQQTVKFLTKDKKFTQKQAEALVEVVGQAHDQLATKKDLEFVEMRLSSEIKGLRNDMDVRFANVETRIADLKSSLSLQMFAGAGLIIAAMGLFQFLGK